MERPPYAQRPVRILPSTRRLHRTPRLGLPYRESFHRADEDDSPRSASPRPQPQRLQQWRVELLEERLRTARLAFVATVAALFLVLWRRERPSPS